MATKKVGELVYADLGKQAVLNEPDGDSISGVLSLVQYNRTNINVYVGNNMSRAEPEWDIDLTD